MVPFLIVSTIGVLVAKRGHLMAGSGIILGTLLDTVFFLYLFSTWSTELDGL